MTSSIADSVRHSYGVLTNPAAGGNLAHYKGAVPAGFDLRSGGARYVEGSAVLWMATGGGAAAKLEIQYVNAADNSVLFAIPVSLKAARVLSIPFIFKILAAGEAVRIRVIVEPGVGINVQGTLLTQIVDS